MSCLVLYDFLSDSRIVLPRPSAARRDAHETWDILRPNERASALVARHLEVLADNVSPEKN